MLASETRQEVGDVQKVAEATIYAGDPELPR